MCRVRRKVGSDDARAGGAVGAAAVAVYMLVVLAFVG